MGDFQPLPVIHVDVRDLASAPGRIGDHAAALLVLWAGDVPLGQEYVCAWQLAHPTIRAHTAAHTIVSAVGDGLLGDDFRVTLAPGRLQQPSPAVHPGSSPPGSGEWSGAEPRDILEASLLGDAQSRHSNGVPETAVSVVISTRDRPEQLDRCLRSLRDATIQPREIVVVDNAPTSPAVQRVLDAHPAVVRVPEERPGLSISRNTGLLHASSDVIAFFDDDVVVHPRCLEQLAEAFDEADVMAVLGLVLPAELETRAQVVFESWMGGLGRGYRRREFDRRFVESGGNRAALVWTMGAGANMAVRRAAFNDVGTFDERLGAGATGCSEDSEFWHRLLMAGWRCRYEPRALVFHYHRRGMDELRRQSHDYARGHVAALFAQYGRFRRRGDLQRAFGTMPLYLARRALTEFGPGAVPRPGTWRTDVTGYLRGLRTFPFAFRRSTAPRLSRDTGPLTTTHKSRLPEFLRRNPYPHRWTEGIFFREKMRAIHTVAPDRPFRDVLELGGGRSGLTALLYPQARVTNVDLDPTLADAAANRQARVRFICGNVTELPFEPESFDAVTMFDVLEHVENDVLALAEAWRVLRPGGALLVTTPNETWRFPFVRPLRWIGPAEDDLIARWAHVRRGYSSGDLERLIGLPPSGSLRFNTPLTPLGHDVSFSDLPRPARRLGTVLLAPLGLVGYALQTPRTPGTETAWVWLKPLR